MQSCSEKLVSYFISQPLLCRLLGTLLVCWWAQHCAVLQGEPLHLIIQFHALGEPLEKSRIGKTGKYQ